MPIFRHILDNMTIALQILQPGILFVLLAYLQILACFVDKLTMSTVIVLSSNIIFYQNVDLNVRVD